MELELEAKDVVGQTPVEAVVAYVAFQKEWPVWVAEAAKFVGCMR